MSLSDEKILQLPLNELKNLENIIQLYKTKKTTLEKEIQEKKTILKRRKELDRQKAELITLDLWLAKFKEKSIEYIQHGHSAKGAIEALECEVSCPDGEYGERWKDPDDPNSEWETDDDEDDDDEEDDFLTNISLDTATPPRDQSHIFGHIGFPWRAR